MRNPIAIACVTALAAAVGAIAHAGEPARQPSVILAQAAPPPPATGGYDPLAPQSVTPRVDPMLPAPSAAPSDSQEEVALNPEFGNLPDTPGVEDTFYLCTACHSAAIIKQQRLPPARWDYLWNWMIEEQGMPEQNPETKATILSYLNRHFSWGK